MGTGKKSPLSLLFRPSFLPQLHLTSTIKATLGTNPVFLEWVRSGYSAIGLAYLGQDLATSFHTLSRTRLSYKIGPRLREFCLGSRNLGPTIQLSPTLVGFLSSPSTPSTMAMQPTKPSPLSPIQLSPSGKHYRTLLVDCKGRQPKGERCQTSANAASFLTAMS